MPDNPRFPWLAFTVIVETVLCGFLAIGLFEAKKREDAATMESMDRGKMLLAMHEKEERQR